MSIKLKRKPKSTKSEYSVYKYKEWRIEDTGINWMVTKGTSASVWHFFTMKEAIKFLEDMEVLK